METFISERVIMTSLTPDDQVQTVSVYVGTLSAV